MTIINRSANPTSRFHSCLLPKRHQLHPPSAEQFTHNRHKLHLGEPSPKARMWTVAEPTERTLRITIVLPAFGLELTGRLAPVLRIALQPSYIENHQGIDRDRNRPEIVVERVRLDTRAC